MAAADPGLPGSDLVFKRDPGLPGSDIVFKRDPGSPWSLIRSTATALAFGGLAALAQGHYGPGSLPLGPPTLVIAGLIGLRALGRIGAYFLHGQCRTVLTPAGIQIRGYFPRFVPWSEVAGFRVRRGRWGPRSDDADEWPQTVSSRRLTVRVIRTSGRQLVLPAPVVTGLVADCEFNDKVRQLQQWRKQYGLPDLVWR